MANSRYEYVKAFEQSATLLPNTYIVVRIDGRGFHKPVLLLWALSCLALIVCRLSTRYGFAKPNDLRALELMNAAAEAVLKELPDISCAYGISDEYRYDANDVAIVC